MTSEPRRTAARNRPDATFRRRALADPNPPARSWDSDGGHGEDGPAPRSATPGREGLRQALARIPDLDADGTGAGVGGVDGADADGAEDAAGSHGDGDGAEETGVDAGTDQRRGDGRHSGLGPSDAGGQLSSGDAPVMDREGPSPSAGTATQGPDAPDSGSVWTDGPPQDLTAAVPVAVADRGRPATDRRPTTSVPPRPPRWRRVAFGVLTVALVASIPALAGTGYRLVTESTDGKLGPSGTSPTEPGYEELVESTPTAVVVQTDADGELVGITFMALGAADQGGSVVFLPVDTLIVDPAYGLNRLASSFALDLARPDEAASIAAREVGKILNVGIDEVIELDDQGWSNVVAPVAPFTIDNLDTLEVDGVTLETGTISLSAELTGPYLGAQLAGEGELARIARQEQVWRGWLQAVAASEVTDAVPGESSSGMGRFASTLAEGTVAYQVLPGETVTGTRSGYQADQDEVDALVADAVPAPDPASPGSRRTVRLLNGVAPGPIPAELSRQVASLGGSVTVVGNGPSFGRDETSIVYADPEQESYAEVLGAALGATGPVRLDREAPDNLDITVVFGRDVLGDVPDDPSAATASTTTAPPGGT